MLALFTLLIQLFKSNKHSSVLFSSNYPIIDFPLQSKLLEYVEERENENENENGNDTGGGEQKDDKEDLGRLALLCLRTYAAQTSAALSGSLPISRPSSHSHGALPSGKYKHANSARSAAYQLLKALDPGMSSAHRVLERLLLGKYRLLALSIFPL